jgi:hypothetical protein
MKCWPMSQMGHFRPIPALPVTPGLPLIATRKADIRAEHFGEPNHQQCLDR